MSKPLNESSNSNQSQRPCEFINRESGFLSKFGSAAIAVGSLATALSIAVPSFGAFVGDTVNSAFGISPATAAVTDNQSPVPGPEQLASTGAVDFMPKSFSFEGLLARVKRRVKSANEAQADSGSAQCSCVRQGAIRASWSPPLQPVPLESQKQTPTRNQP